MKVVVWDLDNCIADDLWRVPHIDWHLEGDERYARYGEHCHRDPVHYREPFEFMRKLGTPVVFTGRTELIRPQTLEWTRAMGIKDEHVFMRKAGDRRGAVVVKREMLHMCFSIRQYVAAFDDLPGVVAMYQECGIAATQLLINPLHHYEPPQHVEHDAAYRQHPTA